MMRDAAGHCCACLLCIAADVMITLWHVRPVLSSQEIDKRAEEYKRQGEWAYNMKVETTQRSLLIPACLVSAVFVRMAPSSNVTEPRPGNNFAIVFAPQKQARVDVLREQQMKMMKEREAQAQGKAPGAQGEKCVASAGRSLCFSP